MQLHQGQPKPLLAILANQTELSHKYELMPTEKSASNWKPSKAWIDSALERLRASFPTWRVTDMTLLALSAEWGKTFGNWRVNADEVDLALEFCKAEWSRVPENVTKGFREMLDRAIEKIKGVSAIEIFPRGTRGFLDALIDAGAKISAKLIEKYPEADKMHDIPALLISLQKTAREKNPKADDMEIYRIVWGMV